MSTGDFDLKPRHAALDAERTSRGLTWTQATRQINSVSRWLQQPASEFIRMILS